MWQTLTLDSHDYQIRTAITPYTLPLGKHTFVVSSTELAHNRLSKTVQFTTVASIDSLKTLVTRFTKLADNDLISFVNEVKPQSGKQISSEAAEYCWRLSIWIDTKVEQFKCLKPKVYTQVSSH